MNTQGLVAAGSAAALPVASPSNAPASERSLEDIKKEVMRRAGRINPFEEIKREDAQQVVDALQSLAGSIGDFTLTVDKGDANNYVSFCGANIKKTGPTTFEMKAKDFVPERDLDILLLVPNGGDY